MPETPTCTFPGSQSYFTFDIFDCEKVGIRAFTTNSFTTNVDLYLSFSDNNVTPGPNHYDRAEYLEGDGK